MSSKFAANTSRTRSKPGATAPSMGNCPELSTAALKSSPSDQIVGGMIAQTPCSMIDRRAPSPLDAKRLTLSGPGRHRHADRGQRFVADAAELKLFAERYRHADAASNVDNLLFVRRTTPQLASSTEKEPDLLDCAMCDRNRRLVRIELEVRHAAPADAQQRAHTRAVGCVLVRGGRQVL